MWDDPSTWNLTRSRRSSRPLSQVGVGDFQLSTRRAHIVAGWLQDDWTIDATPDAEPRRALRPATRRVGRGRRVAAVAVAERRGRTTRTTSAPRLGFAYSLERPHGPARRLRASTTATARATSRHQTALVSRSRSPQISNDGRPDFASNPFNGPVPTYDQVAARRCARRQQPARLHAADISSRHGQRPTYADPYSYQASIGVQRQIGTTMSIEADYVYTGEPRRGRRAQHQPELQPGDRRELSVHATSAGVPFPDWGVVSR